MASSIALRRAATYPLFSKLINPFVRSASVAPISRSFNTEAQVTNIGSDGAVDVDRSSSNRGVSLRRDTSPGFFPDVFDPFSPSRSLSQVFNLMDQLMDFPFVETPRSVGAGSCGGGGARLGWDAKEDNEAVYLRFDMPGLSKDDVKVCVEDNTLIIRGERPKENDEEEGGRRYSCRLDLPQNLYKLDEIKAGMKNGVLKVVVPKVKEEERRNIHEVKIE